MASDYVIQIAHKATGKVVEWAPGCPVERQIEDELAARLDAKGVGIGKSSVHVLEDLRAAWRELVHELKAEIR